MKQHIASFDIGLFSFAPLNGNIAQEELKDSLKRYQELNTLVLIEDYKDPIKRKIWIRSRAVFRIYWLRGGFRKLIGMLFFLPPTVGDFFYRLIAKHRHHFFK